MDGGTTRWLVAALAAGCVHGGADPGAGAETPPDIARDLARFAALDVVEIGGLALSDFASGSCYGLCPEDEAEGNRVQGPRLRALVERAEAAVADGRTCEGVDAGSALRALRRLEIVEVEALIVEEAMPDPMCYNVPCPAEVERVEAENCRRVGDLAAIVEAARDL